MLKKRMRVVFGLNMGLDKRPALCRGWDSKWSLWLRHPLLRQPPSGQLVFPLSSEHCCRNTFLQALTCCHLSTVLSRFCVKLTPPSCLVFEAPLVWSCFHFNSPVIEAGLPVLSMLVWISPFMAEDNKQILLPGPSMKTKNRKSASPHRRWN